MAVPDNDIFSLVDVNNTVNPTQSNLTSCFSSAYNTGFDPRYKGNKDRLSNFRNYKHNASLKFIELAPSTTSPSGSCTLSGQTLIAFHNGNGLYPVVGDTLYTTSSGTTALTIQNSWRYVYGSGFSVQTDSLGVVSSIHTCASTGLRGFACSTKGKNLQEACALFADQTYYHNGAGQYPTLNDNVYADAAGTQPLEGGQYKYGAVGTLIIEFDLINFPPIPTGKVVGFGSCGGVQTTPIQMTTNKYPTEALLNCSDTAYSTYYHDGFSEGANSYPVVGDTIYDNAAGTQPHDGSTSGINGWRKLVGGIKIQINQNGLVVAQGAQCQLTAFDVEDEYSYGDLSAACYSGLPNGKTRTLYHNGDSAIPAGGDTVYQDPNGQFPYPGNNNCRYLQGIGQFGAAIQISATGLITDIALCTYNNNSVAVNVKSFQISVAKSGQIYGTCSLSLATTQTLYFDGTTTYPTLDKIVYTDPSLTTVYSGGYDWYRTADGVSTIQIANSGRVTVVSPCVQ